MCGTLKKCAGADEISHSWRSIHDFQKTIDKHCFNIEVLRDHTADKVDERNGPNPNLLHLQNAHRLSHT